MSTKKTIPTTITVNGVELQVKDSPELLALIEAVRGTEKDKLYGEISGLEARIKVAEDEKKASGTQTAAEKAELDALKRDLGAKEAQLVAANAALEEAKKVKKTVKKADDADEDPSAKALAEMKSFFTAQMEGFKKEVGDLKTEFTTKVGEVQSGLQGKTVGDYRKEQLAKYEKVLIPALVPENLDSVEAVNKAILSALEVSKDYVRQDHDGKSLTLREIEALSAANKGAENGQAPGGVYTPPTAPAAPGGGDGDVTGKSLLAKVSSMSPEEYAKHRSTLLQEAKSIKVGAD